MGKNILVPCFDVYNDRPFPEKYTVKDHISNTKLEKGDHYYIQKRHNDREYYFLATANTRYFKLSSKTKGHAKKEKCILSSPSSTRGSEMHQL